MSTRKERNRKEKKIHSETIAIIISFLALLVSGVEFFKDWHEQKESIEMYVDYVTLDNDIILEKTNNYNPTFIVGESFNSEAKEIILKERIFIDINLRLIINNKSSNPTSITSLDVGTKHDITLKITDNVYISPKVKKIVADNEIVTFSDADGLIFSKAIQIGGKQTKVINIALSYPVYEKLNNIIEDNYKMGESISAIEFMDFLRDYRATIFGDIPDPDLMELGYLYQPESPEFQILITTANKKIFTNDKQDEYSNLIY